jgi:hypothetical protein
VLSLQSASDDLRQMTEVELSGAGQAADVVAPKTLVPSGETRDIHRAGGSCITLVGSNPLFRLPQDRRPHAVDTDVVTPGCSSRSRFGSEADTLQLPWREPSARTVGVLCVRKGDLMALACIVRLNDPAAHSCGLRRQTNIAG